MSDSTTTTRLSRAKLSGIEAAPWQYSDTDLSGAARDARAYMTALEAIRDGGCDHYTHGALFAIHKDCPTLIAAAALGRLP